MKESFLKGARLICAFAAMLVLFGVNKADASASVGMTAVTQNSFTVSWNNTTTTQFYLGYSTDDSFKGMDAAKNMALAKSVPLSSATKSYTFSSLKPGTQVHVCLAYTTTDYKTKQPKMWTTTTTCASLPGQVTGLNQSKWYRIALTLYGEWDDQTGASGYEYVIKNSKGKTVKSDTTPGNTFSLNNVKNSMVYTAQVRAYEDLRINGVTKRYYGDWSPVAYFMTQPGAKPYRGYTSLGLELKLSGGKLTVGWEKVQGLSGYNVYVTDKKYGKFTKVKKGLKASATKAVIKKVGKKKIKNNKTYYVYVEGYKKVKGKTYTTGLNYITYTGRGSSTRSSVIYKDAWDNKR